MQHTAADRAYDILRSEYRPLDAIFAPKAIAVIGATERPGSVGRTILWNLISNSFGDCTIYPINPKRRSVLGIRAYPNIAAIPELVDLAIIATPAPTVPDIISECVEIGVKGAIVISAGFKETGTAGVELERQVLEQVHRGNMRLIGPNCLGVMNPTTGLNATFANSMARPGKVGFISQSGALCTAILDWSLRENVGFSAFVSIGSMLDVSWGDLIYYLGDDPQTESIVIYMESIGDARSFLSAAREVALTKPIIVIKAGRTEAAAKAAASHTGALAGSDAVLDAAFRRSGVLRVANISDLFDMAEVLAKQPRTKGPHLTIITNAGGPGVLATDALIATGGELAELSEDAIASLDSILPAHWSHSNPIDILGDADPSRYTKALEIAARDPNSNGLLVILTPQAMTDPSQTAKQLQSYAKLRGKPILASWMGGNDVAAGEAILNQAGIPTYRYPDAAARVFSYMWKYSYNLQGIYETPVLPKAEGEGMPNRKLVEQIINTAHQENRTLLTEFESKQVLEAYGISTVETRIATSEEEAVACADAIGYPVVLKLFSQTITHKTDVGGVQLNLPDAAAVRRAYQEIQAGVAKWEQKENTGKRASGIGQEASGSQRRAGVSPVEATGVIGQGASGNGQGASGNGQGASDMGKKTNSQCPIPNAQSPIPNAQSPIPNAQSPIPNAQSPIPNAQSPMPPNFLGVTVQPMVKLKGYELIIGSSIDAQFGPVLLFGFGGELVEVFGDRAIALPPLNTTLARRMMEQTRIYKALQGVRGHQPVDLTALEQLLVRFSQLVVEQPWIKEIDINPLLARPIAEESREWGVGHRASGIGHREMVRKPMPNPQFPIPNAQFPMPNAQFPLPSLIALDARVVLHPADLSFEQLPKGAIRPYPTQYVASWTMKDGTPVTIRPIRPEDEPLMVQFHKTLSEQSVYFRYFHLIKLKARIAHERLTRICFIDYDREMALVADYKNPQTGEHQILAVGRLSKLHGTNEAEFAMLVGDPFQCRGLGSELLRRLIQVARDEHLERITAEILSENSAMQRVCEKLGFRIYPTADNSVVKVEINLTGS